ncbi:MAG: hypothetical protein JNM39_12765 [Bdellovibrionaceae bacterium]|nr:hypothetical protein [Pseudobdellovibrionaceae bacterium]
MGVFVDFYLSFYLVMGLVILSGIEAQARVFNLPQEQFSSYLLVNGSSAPLADSPWVLESAATGTSKSYSTVTGGEFGFIFTSRMIGWRFGFEIFKPAKLNDIEATQGGATVYNVSSDMTGYAPKLGIEITPWITPRQKAFLFGYVGTASLTLKNDYTSLTIAPNSDHTVEMTGTGSLTGGGVGYEIHFFDTTTFLLEAAYRTLKIDELTYSKAVTTFSSPGEGSVVPGQPVLKTDGTKRTIDFSGPYVTVGLRFWL